MKVEQLLLVEMLEGKSVDVAIKNEVIEYAEQNNLVFVWADDELLQMEGILDGEAWVYGGQSLFFLNGQPLFLDDSEFDCEGKADVVEFRQSVRDHKFAYVLHELSVVKLGDGTYVTHADSVPHKVFRRMRDGKVCEIGVVIDRDDLMKKE